MLDRRAVEGMPGSAPSIPSASKILRRHAELVGLRSGFTILDTDDQIRLMKQVLEAENIDEKRWPARGCFAASSMDWKNRGLDARNVPAGERARLSPMARAASSTPPIRNG